MRPTGSQRWYGMTDVGRERDINEDQFLVADLRRTMIVHHSSLAAYDETRFCSESEGQLLIVAAGMGGAAAGERASELTVDSLTQHVLDIVPRFFRLPEKREDELLDRLKAAVAQCESVVNAEAATNPNCTGMATTLTMACVIWPRLYVVHVGDSRCYLLRRSTLEQITRDHTVAQRLVDDGAMKRTQARASQLNCILTNAIGRGPEKLRPDVYKAQLEVGDTLLLCTDGLIRHLPDKEIARVLQARRSEQEVCQELVAAANGAGGSDNITVIVARYVKDRAVASGFG